MQKNPVADKVEVNHLSERFIIDENYKKLNLGKVALKILFW